ncbi:hypothetical protein [Streptomyces sp. 35G-GA-8]|uniref:hypothetical protein n=1 Tax=Streptomyces sp. 35G-GA-8 TaxID=2939434 RepID=UPI00201F5219|nr:hypothetical protein [Streptomyces sp. 35G-GA-8]MCL7377500.1 hypothetical protein [Streptomyces sp. 35G-GA-8]
MIDPETPRTHIPSLCWIERPDDVLRCTEHDGHDGDHYHCHSHASWPREAGETQ